MENRDRMKVFIDKGITGCGLVAGALILLNGIITTYDVGMRYLFNSPTIWVYEISIYLVIIASFISFAYVLLEKRHVKVDFITSHLYGRASILLEITTSLVCILYCVVLGWEGFKIAAQSFQAGYVSASILRVPVWIPKSFIPLGCALLTFQFTRYIKDLFRSVIDRESRKGEEKVVSPSTEGSMIRSLLAPVIFIMLLILTLVLLKESMNLGLLLLFFVLLFSGLPVAFALGLFGVFGMYFLFGGSSLLIQTPIIAYSTLDSNVAVALPLFVLTGCVLRRAGVGERIFKFANVLAGHLPGGLGIASVIFCCLFAAMTGSSVAVAATASMIAFPEMIARGYSRKMSIGLLCAGGTLGILFPPSLALILYGAMTNESIGSLFAASLIPGIILASMFCIYVAVVAGKDKNIQRLPRATFKEILLATKEASGGLIAVVIIMGGIYTGVFTPTESAAIAALYSIILSCFIYRSISWRALRESFLEMILLFSMIMFMVIGANITGQVILMARIPHSIMEFVTAMAASPWITILSINIFLIIMGGPLEAVTILVITLPILYPLVTSLGFNGLWFGVLMVVNMELALISPPEGLNLFILQDLTKSTSSEVSRGVIPFLILICIFLALICAVPSLTTWLPSVIMK